MDSSDIKKIKNNFNLISNRLNNIQDLISNNPVETLVTWYNSSKIKCLGDDKDIRNILPKKNYNIKNGRI